MSNILCKLSINRPVVFLISLRVVCMLPLSLWIEVAVLYMFAQFAYTVQHIIFALATQLTSNTFPCSIHYTLSTTRCSPCCICIHFTVFTYVDASYLYAWFLVSRSAHLHRFAMRRLSSLAVIGGSRVFQAYAAPSPLHPRLEQNREEHIFIDMYVICITQYIIHIYIYI